MEVPIFGEGRPLKSPNTVIVVHHACSRHVSVDVHNTWVVMWATLEGPQVGGSWPVYITPCLKSAAQRHVRCCLQRRQSERGHGASREKLSAHQAPEPHFARLQGPGSIGRLLQGCPRFCRNPEATEL